MSLLERLESDGPKRILSLDGGGIRGIISIGFLERIESLLRKRHGSPDLQLCDYFDLIGGTSTGAIIAVCVALGMDTATIKNLYLEIGSKVFGRKKIKKWEALYDEKPFREVLNYHLGDKTLGDPSIGTGLCIITKRADTGSTWPLLNHPRGKFYPENSNILLSDAVRASTAAPVYFLPKKIDLGGGQVGTFIDGGISMANNPALQLFLVSTLKGFPFCWAAVEDRLLLVSVGTGAWHFKTDPERMARSKAWDWAALLPEMFIRDANWHDQLILQYLSRTPTPWRIDSESGDLVDDLLLHSSALSYLRYDVLLEADALENLGFPELVDKLDSLRDISDTSHVEELAETGERAAEVQVSEAHFPSAFDLPEHRIGPLYPELCEGMPRPMTGPDGSIESRSERVAGYIPKPLDTTNVELGQDILGLREQLAENVHEIWARQRIADGWKYGPERNSSRKEHDCLVPYDDLPESEREYDRKVAMETLKAIIELGYKIEKAE